MLFIIKPDAVERRLMGRILAHVEEKGFQVLEARLTRLTREERRPICRITMDVRNQHDRPVFRAEVSKLGDPGLCTLG
jgi:nucleoside diphosphate kinase